MNIASLEVRNLRVIREARIEPVAHINLIEGGNGAGKTSLLEAIFLLARGRTFRSSRYGSLVTAEARELSLKGQIVNGDDCGVVELVFGAGSRKRLLENGNLVPRMRDLRDRIQVRVVVENSQRLLEGEPAMRRLFLDWNLFHVEQHYARLRSTFRRILGQRNAWLRGGAPGSRVWDDAYIEVSEKITSLRERYVRELSNELQRLHRQQPEFPLLQTKLDQGWPPEKTLADALCSSFSQDIVRGYTRFGPARADLCVNVSGSTGIGSRGRAKVFVCLLQLAAQRIEHIRSQRNCVWLVDDLGAELDSRATFGMLDAFVGTGEQIFLTARERTEAMLSLGNREQCRVFHVEHGDFTL